MHVENWRFSPWILNIETRVKKVIVWRKGRFKSEEMFIEGRVFVTSYSDFVGVWNICSTDGKLTKIVAHKLITIMSTLPDRRLYNLETVIFSPVKPNT
jgi:hypothetical protein